MGESRDEMLELAEDGAVLGVPGVDFQVPEVDSDEVEPLPSL